MIKEMDNNQLNYFSFSMPYDPRREVVWREITKYLKRYINKTDHVLELGAGYCHFINNVIAAEKYALDLDGAVLEKYATKNVHTMTGNVLEIDKIFNHKFDVIFASNLLEHLPINELHRLLPLIRDRLKKNGRFIVLQPNYRYAFKEYFDDFTHITVLDHLSLQRLLLTHSFKVKKVYKKFLPYTIESKLPVFSWLVYLYLRSPIKVMGKQMLLIASNSANKN
jgi:SAM-dependent methyltransferase